jgi:hypothetical protein
VVDVDDMLKFDLQRQFVFGQREMRQVVQRFLAVERPDKADRFLGGKVKQLRRGRRLVADGGRDALAGRIVIPMVERTADLATPSLRLAPRCRQ